MPSTLFTGAVQVICVSVTDWLAQLTAVLPEFKDIDSVSPPENSLPEIVRVVLDAVVIAVGLIVVITGVVTVGVEVGVGVGITLSPPPPPLPPPPPQLVNADTAKKISMVTRRVENGP